LLKANKGSFKKGENSGEKHPRWKGGRWLYWRKQVLIRDDYTCQKCGLKEPEIMDVHHKIPVKLSYEKRRELESKKLIDIVRLGHGIQYLITLCPNCHRREHCAINNCSFKTPLKRRKHPSQRRASKPTT
jgi:5-methylcytosine-specific restriction endonuclease McrA